MEASSGSSRFQDVDVALHYVVHSVLATAQIAPSLPLEAVATLPNIAHTVERHKSYLTARVGSGRTFVAIRGTGVVEVRGAKSVTAATEIILEIARLCGRLAAVDPNPEVVVKNLVLSADYGRPLSLTQLAFALPAESVEFEPEQFPGLILHCTGRSRALLFSSGKIVITGVKSIADAEEALTAVQETLDQATA